MLGTPTPPSRGRAGSLPALSGICLQQGVGWGISRSSRPPAAPRRGRACALQPQRALPAAQPNVG